MSDILTKLLLSDIQSQIHTARSDYYGRMRIWPDMIVMSPAAEMALKATLNPREYMLRDTVDGKVQTIFNMIVYISSDVVTFRVAWGGES